MTLKERLAAIKKLEDEHKLEFAVMRVFGKLTLFGSQIGFGVDNDFVSEAELKLAIEGLVEELNGSVKWKK